MAFPDSSSVLDKFQSASLGTLKTSSLLPTRRKGGGRETGLCFARFVFLTFRGPLASHDSNPYPSRSRIARCNATKALGPQAEDSTHIFGGVD